MQSAAERVLTQYTHFEGRTLAVRGERLQLYHNHWSDDAGNETTYLHVFEIDGDGLIAYECRFEPDDFEGAYRELDRRYYAGEAAEYAESGAALTEVVTAQNRGDLDKVFGELCVPTLRIENRSRSAFPDRTAAELRASMEELDAMVGSSRTWYSAVNWLSRNWAVARMDRAAVGLDDETYEWIRLYVIEIRDGLGTSICEFDVEDEDAAFAHAEERMRASSSRLAVNNRASQIVDAVSLLNQANELDGAIAAHSDRFVYDDRRKLSGHPVEGLAEFRVACERFREHYPYLAWRTLAVRGERLALNWGRAWDDAGNEAAYFAINEVGDDGRITHQVRFDGDDFKSAYRELDRRYYAGEGAEYAETGAALTETVIAHNRGDLARVFDELCSPDLHIENRSRSGLPDRSAAELRASTEELQAMFASVRMCYSVMCWLSRNWAIARQDREAVGPDGERYEWTHIYVTEFRNGYAASICYVRC